MPSGVERQDLQADILQFGRGLLLVGALAARWGWEPRSVGKTVYAEWDLPTPAVVVVT